MEKNEVINRQSRLQTLFSAAQQAGFCTNYKEFAEFIGMNVNTVSRAKQGDERCLTDSFFIRIENAFNRRGINVANNTAPINLQEGDSNQNSQSDVQVIIAEMAEQRKSYEVIIRDLIAKLK